ncbi:schlafen-like protein 1 [Halichondria panicea]|uniref:schlafen-like protein 1 n=1 Tax=Halichondria panicea TaxID=6063 RepID=UPI00312B8DD6
MCAQISEDGGVYVMTPETPFTPSDAVRENKHSVYRMGSYRSKKESRNMEYKTGSGSYVWNTLPEHIQKYGSAFLNSGGGTLCIGVADSGEITGVCLRVEDREKVRKLIRQEFIAFTPSISDDLYEIEFVPCNRDKYFVIEIHVRAGDPSEIYSDRHDKMYVKRDGSLQGPLWPRDIVKIVEDKFMKGLIKTRDKKESK